MEIWIVIAIIAFIWWAFSGGTQNNSRRTVTYTDQKTGQLKKEARERRRAQTETTVDKPVDFEITAEIEKVLDVLENSDRNVFLTGKAGTGKSTLLRYFRATTGKYPVVVAPTGVAAVNVQGQTIHSFFGWGISITPDRVRRVSYEKAKIYRKMKMLIIDEISMVRADIFDCIDRFLRLNTGNPDAPFGGVQIVAIGDLYQLPPVVKGAERKLYETKYSSPFFFSTDAFVRGKFVKFELNKVYRQKDPEFVSALNAIREGAPKEKHIQLLNQSVISKEPDDFDDYVHLVTTNAMAQEINDARMLRLLAEPVTYTGSIFGSFKEKDAPTALELTLKVGAKVMLLNNDRKRRWVNGDIVRILKTNSDSLLVEFADRSVEEIERHTWETIRFVFDEEEQKIVLKKVGGFTQIPVKPAWAMTIHKAQGKTFDKMFIDLGAGAFAEGQTYVALSRCKSLDGLRLAAPIALHHVFVNETVKDFMAFAHGNRGELKPKSTTSIPSRNDEPTQRSSKEEIMSTGNSKLTKEEFVLQAIKKLRTKNYKGIHVVYSGFNEAFWEYFNEDPVECVSELEKRNIVVTHPVRGGVMLYDAREVKAKESGTKGQSKALGKILEE